MKDIALALLLAFAPAISTNAASGEAAGVVGDDLKFETYNSNWEREIKTNVSAEAKYSCECPVEGGKALVENAQRWICSYLGDDDGDYIGAVDNLLQTTARGTFDELCELAAEEDPDWEMTLSSEVEIRKLYEDDSYVTLIYFCSVYMGGAHPTSAQACATFRKSDGQRMGWDLLRGMNADTKERKIKDGLRSYFEVKTDSELLEELLLEEEDFYNAFPLPESEPYLTEEGVEVIYQQYEIAPYACGMPSCVVVPMKAFKAK